jgi:hypothetical protein
MAEESFLKKYVRLVQDTEIPGIFALWSGLAAISAILGRKVWVDRGVWVCFPNLFIVLVASSGRCRKSTSIGITEKLLNRIEPTPPNLISQKLTPEAIIQAMKVDLSDENSQYVKTSCTGYVLADEFSTFLNKKTYEDGLAALLIQMFDCKSKFEYHTRSRGVERLEDVCLGILGGSTIEWIKEAIPISAIAGGLTSRIIFVYAAEPPRSIMTRRLTPEQIDLQGQLVEILQDLQSIEGEMTLSDEAEAYYEAEYHRFYAGTSFFANKYLSGYASRRHVHMLKLAMLFSVISSKENRKIIDVSDLSSALRTLDLVEKYLPLLMNIITSSEYGAILDEVYQFIRESSAVDRRTITNRFIHRIDQNYINGILSSLITAGRIKCTEKGASIIYSCSDKP